MIGVDGEVVAPAGTTSSIISNKDQSSLAHRMSVSSSFRNMVHLFVVVDTHVSYARFIARY